MRTFSLSDANQACTPIVTCVDFSGCTEIEPAAVGKIVQFIRTHEAGCLMLTTDDHAVFQTEAISRLLREENASVSLTLNCRGKIPAELHSVLRSTDASLFFDEQIVPEPNLLECIGAAERDAVTLALPADGDPTLLRQLRRVRSLNLKGLQRLDDAAARALLDGNPLLSDIMLPQLEWLSPVAADLIGKAGLKWLMVGPVLRRAPDADGWLACPGLIEQAGLPDLTLAEADRLLASAAHCLSFITPFDLSTEAARRLAQFPRTLSIIEQREISVAMARGLQGWRGRLIVQTDRLSPEAAEWLQSDNGQLELGIGINETPVDEAVILAVAENGGRNALELVLFNQHVLSDRAAKALAARKGKVGVSTQAVGWTASWQSLAELTGPITVQDMALTPELAECLGRHQGPLELGLSQMPSATEAARLSEHRGGKLTLRFHCRDAEITGEVGVYLAEYAGELTLDGVTAIDAVSLQALERRGGRLRILAFQRSDELEAAMSHLRAVGALRAHFPEPSDESSNPAG